MSAAHQVNLRIPPLSEAQSCLLSPQISDLVSRIETLFKVEAAIFNLARLSVPLERERVSLVDQLKIFSPELTHVTSKELEDDAFFMTARSPTFDSKSEEGWYLTVLMEGNHVLHGDSERLYHFNKDPNADQKLVKIINISQSTKNKSIYDTCMVYITFYRLNKMGNLSYTQKESLEKILLSFGGIETLDLLKLNPLFPFLAEVIRLVDDPNLGFGQEDLLTHVRYASDQNYLQRQSDLLGWAKSNAGSIFKEYPVYPSAETIADALSRPLRFKATVFEAPPPLVKEPLIKSDGQKWIEEVLQRSRPLPHLARVKRWRHLGDRLENIRSFEGYKNTPDEELLPLKIAHTVPCFSRLFTDEFLDRYAKCQRKKESTAYYFYGVYNGKSVVVSYGISLAGKVYHLYACPPETEGGRLTLKSLTPGIPSFNEKFESVNEVNEILFEETLYSYDEDKGTIIIEDTKMGNKLALTPIRIEVELKLL